MFNKSSLSAIIGLAALSVFKKQKSGNRNKVKFEEMTNFFAEKYNVKNAIGSRSAINALIIRNEQMLEDPLSYVRDPADITLIEFYETSLPNGVPDWLPLFYNTEELILSETGISHLPPSVFTLKNLEILDVSRNPIHTLPEDIKKLRNLKVLDLTRTNISFLPDRMFDYLQNVYHFEALQTPLRQINSDILNSSLSTLILENNGRDINFNFSMHELNRAVLDPNRNGGFTIAPHIVKYFIDMISRTSSSQLRRF